MFDFGCYFCDYFACLSAGLFACFVCCFVLFGFVVIIAWWGYCFDWIVVVLLLMVWFWEFWFGLVLLHWLVVFGLFVCVRLVPWFWFWFEFWFVFVSLWLFGYVLWLFVWFAAVFGVWLGTLCGWYAWLNVGCCIWTNSVVVFGITFACTISWVGFGLVIDDLIDAFGIGCLNVW